MSSSRHSDGGTEVSMLVYPGAWHGGASLVADLVFGLKRLTFVLQGRPRRVPALSASGESTARVGGQDGKRIMPHTIFVHVPAKERLQQVSSTLQF